MKLTDAAVAAILTDATVKPLSWQQTDPNLQLDYADALVYAAGLESDGQTLSAAAFAALSDSGQTAVTIAGIAHNGAPVSSPLWRLPTIDELFAGLFNAGMVGGTGSPSAFVGNATYWSSNLRLTGNRYRATNGAPTGINLQTKTEFDTVNVRCVTT